MKLLHVSWNGAMQSWIILRIVFNPNVSSLVFFFISTGIHICNQMLLSENTPSYPSILTAFHVNRRDGQRCICTEPRAWGLSITVLFRTLCKMSRCCNSVLFGFSKTGYSALRRRPTCFSRGQLAELQWWGGGDLLLNSPWSQSCFFTVRLDAVQWWSSSLEMYPRWFWSCPNAPASSPVGSALSLSPTLVYSLSLFKNYEVINWTHLHC